jgi:hypothetical protein
MPIHLHVEFKVGNVREEHWEVGIVEYDAEYDAEKHVLK